MRTASSPLRRLSSQPVHIGSTMDDCEEEQFIISAFDGCVHAEIGPIRDSEEFVLAAFGHAPIQWSENLQPDQDYLSASKFVSAPSVTRLQPNDGSYEDYILAAFGDSLPPCTAPRRVQASSTKVCVEDKPSEVVGGYMGASINEALQRLRENLE